MFNVGGGELMVILLVALLVLGPDKLPETARKIGKVLTEVRRMSQGFQDEMRSAMDLHGDDSPTTSPGPRLVGPPPSTIETTGTETPDVASTSGAEPSSTSDDVRGAGGTSAA